MSGARWASTRRQLPGRRGPQLQLLEEADAAPLVTHVPIEGMGIGAAVVAGDLDQLASLLPAPLLDGLDQLSSKPKSVCLFCDDQHWNASYWRWPMHSDHTVHARQADDLLLQRGDDRRLACF